MINVCARCGLYRDDKFVDTQRSVAICPECGYAHPISLEPLFILGGASGTGKSAVTRALTGAFTGVVVLEADILWMEEFNAPEAWSRYFNLWLRLAKNISQAGKPVLLSGAGFGVPGNLAGCVESRYFRAIHYVALVCDDEELARRLRERPAWRDTHDAAFVAEQIQFNRWYQTEGPAQEPPVALVDTTGVTVDAVCAQVQAWVEARLYGS